MKLSYQWLNEYLECDVSAQEIGTLLTKHAQEVAGVKALFDASMLTFGNVLKTEAIAGSKNKKCTVLVAGSERTIVCGASNVAAGQTVIVALPKAVLPGGKKIEVAQLGDVTSEGMICSLSEIGVSPKFIQEDGIHVVTGDADDAWLKDQVIELDLTPNRMDLLSVLGCAYEVGALIDKKVKVPEITLKESTTKNPYKIVIETDDCHRYYGRLIENIKVQESPEWLKMRLLAAGIRPINNIVDITNYVMIDLGQPLHAFDDETLTSKTIKVRNALPKEKFTTLDNQSRTLQAHDIVITDDDKPIALGGVMGGLDSEVTEKTTRVFLESAVFEPKTISKTSRRLDLRSESSMRFERGVATDRTLIALNKAAALMASLGGGQVASNIASAERVKPVSKTISLPLSKINQTLGLALDKSAVRSIFHRLDLPFNENDTVFEVNVPPRRLDLEIAADLIEEIGRLHGYDLLPSTYPSTVSEGFLSPSQQKRRRLKSHLESLGFNEVITYSLSEEKKDLPFIKHSRPVSVLRPLNEENQTLKQSTIPGLLQVLSYHQARQMEDVKIYEWSKAYTQDTEEDLLGFAWVGRAYEPSWVKSQGVDFYQIKGVLESIAEHLHLKPTYQISSQDGFHPHQSADMMVGDVKIGQVGQVHPLVLRSYDLENVFVAEINISKALSIAQEMMVYEPVSKVPFVKRDVAFIVPKTMMADQLIKAAVASKVDAVTDIEIIDVYQGEPLNANEKSVTIRVYLKSEETFKTEAIDERMKALTESLKKTLNLTQRT